MLNPSENLIIMWWSMLKSHHGDQTTEHVCLFASPNVLYVIQSGITELHEYFAAAFSEVQASVMQTTQIVPSHLVYVYTYIWDLVASYSDILLLVVVVVIQSICFFCFLFFFKAKLWLNRQWVAWTFEWVFCATAFLKKHFFNL